MVKRSFLGALVALAAYAAQADELAQQKLQNWHQWRGPLATGVAPQGNPPTEWSTTKNVKWKVPIPGRGSGSPIVWGDQIFILTAVKTDRVQEPAAESKTSANHIDVKFRFAAHSLAAVESNRSEFFLAQRDAAKESERGQGGRGFRGRGGFGRGFGRRGGQAPTNYHQFIVLCIDRNTGQTKWQRTAAELVPHEGHHETGSFASASAITDGKFVYASFGSRGLYCFDLDGNPQWDKDLGDMQTRMGFGEGTSPALYGDTLVQTWDQEAGSFIVALDANTGDERWRQPRDEPTTWATPLIVAAAGRIQVITSGTNRVRSYDLKNGELIWECGGLGSNPIASPIVYKDLAICMTGHHDPAGVAVPLDATGDVTDTDKVAWRIKESTPYVATPVLYDDTIYFTKSRNAILSSIDAKTGRYIIDQKRLAGIDSIYASPVAANGHVYISSREGKTVVVKHAPQLEVVATNDLEETIDASPAIVGDELIIRTDGNLYCIAEE
jgi:outer membrane protein assembly factor BamB